MVMRRAFLAADPSDSMVSFQSRRLLTMTTCRVGLASAQMAADIIGISPSNAHG